MGPRCTSRDNSAPTGLPQFAKPTNPEFYTKFPVTVHDDDFLTTQHHIRPRQQGKMKFLKVGRVAIITRGRYAGKKVRLPPK